jgi:hypothetical protein
MARFAALSCRRSTANARRYAVSDDSLTTETPELSIRDKLLVEVVGAIAGPSTSPGSGTAASLVLILAAACAHKSLSVTRKHRPLEAAEESTALELTTIIERAFDSADRDASSFAAFLRDRDAEAARALLESDRLGQEVTSSFESLLRRIGGAIEPMASGDVTAAWDLLAVVQRIQAMIAEGNEVLTAAALSA